MIIGIAAAVLILGGAGVGAWWLKGHRPTPEKIQSAIAEEFARKQLALLTVAVTPDWEAKVSGTVEDDAQKNSALDLVKSHKQIRKIIDAIAVWPALRDVQEILSETLAPLDRIVGTMEGDYVARLTGDVASNQEKSKAEALAAGVQGVKSVANSIVVKRAPAPSPSERDPATLEQLIGARLREKAFNNVRARVAANYLVTLTGTVRSDSEKARVFEILADFVEITKSPRDLIFVAPE